MLGVDGLHRGEHIRARALIQLAGRLVGEQHARLVRERDRDRHPLLLAAAQLSGSLLGHIGDVEQFEQRLRTARAFRLRHHAGDAVRQGDVLACGEVRQQVAP